MLFAYGDINSLRECYLLTSFVIVALGVIKYEHCEQITNNIANEVS